MDTCKLCNKESEEYNVIIGETDMCFECVCHELINTYSKDYPTDKKIERVAHAIEGYLKMYEADLMYRENIYKATNDE